MILFRPTGLEELRLVFESGMRSWPPRLPEQPIFYPVLNHGYAAQIASDWNTKSDALAGYVTRFEVADAFADQFERKIVGGRDHEELWVPASQLEELNQSIVGRIELVDGFFGSGFTGYVPAAFALAGKNALQQLETLGQMLSFNAIDFSCEVVANSAAVFLHFPFWSTLEAGDVRTGDRDLPGLLDAIWVRWSQVDQPAQLWPARHAT